MVTRFTTTAETIRMLCEIILDHGTSKAELSRKAELNLAELEDRDTLFPLETLLSLWQLAVDATGDPALGLHLRNHFPENRIHFLARISIYSSNLMEAAQHWTQFINSITSSFHLELLHENNRIIIRFINTSPKHRSVWLPEYNLSSAVQIARYLTNKPIAPLETRFQHPDPGYAKEYEMVFRSPVLFNQRKTEMLMKREDMEEKIVLHDPYLQSIIKKIADNRVSQKKFRNAKEAVTHHIEDCLKTGSVSLRMVAQAMNMDSNMLYRKLKSEGRSFKQLLEETRKTLSKQYLERDLTTKQISSMLGFSQSSSFHHAFRRWFGIRLKDYVNHTKAPTQHKR